MWKISNDGLKKKRKTKGKERIYRRMHTAKRKKKISGETSEHLEIKVGLRQGCVMSPWLFNIYMDGGNEGGR